MAVRVKSRWHRGSARRGMKEIASVIAALGWRLALQAIQRMRQAGFEIEPGAQYYAVVCEHLAFVLHVADRIAYRLLDADQRTQFTIALGHGLAGIVEDNSEVLAGAASAACGEHLIDIVNQRADDYASLHFDESGPSFAFCCYFGNQMRELMVGKDRSWVVDQVIEIEAPDAVKALKKALGDLLSEPPAAPHERSGNEPVKTIRGESRRRT
jgi:hypothetical protein